MRYKPEPVTYPTIHSLTTYVTKELDRIAETFINPDPVWEDLKVSLSTAKAGANPPGFEVFKGNVRTYLFDGSSLEEVHFDVQLPHAFVEKSGVIKPHIHWSPTTADSGTVRWGLEYTWANYGDTFGNTTSIGVSQACNGDHEHQIAAFPDIDATGMAISSVLVCRLYRDPTHTDDNYSPDAAGISVDFHIQLDTNGSELEYIKRTLS